MANVKFEDLTANPSIDSTDLLAVSKNGGGSRKSTISELVNYIDATLPRYWDRTGTTIQPDNAGDDLDMGTGDVNAANVDVTGNYQISNNRVLAIDTDRGQLFVGYDAGINTQINGSAYRNTAVGDSALEDNITAGYNTAVGFSALSLNLAEGNTGIGAQALRGNLNGTENTAIGHQVGANHYDGDKNVFLGAYAGLGGSTSNTYTKNNNTMVGYASGQNTLTGSGNVFLGYLSGYNETGSNKLYIENSNSATPLIYGEFDTNLVKINGTFQSTGNVTIGAGAAGVDYTLTFDGEDNDGVITWLEDEDAFDMSCGFSLNSGQIVTEFSTDGTLAGDSDAAIPTEKAVKKYVDDNALFWTRTVTTLSPTTAGDDLDMGTGTIEAQTAIISGNLEVDGYIKNPTNISFVAQATAPAMTDGTVYYSSSSNNFQFRENGAWVTLGGGSGYWNRTGTTIEPATAGDDLDMGTGYVEANEIRITDATLEDYHIKTGGVDYLNFWNTVSGGSAYFSFYSNDGDNTDDVGLVIYGTGTPGSTSNGEYLALGYGSSDTEYIIETRANGSGTARDLEIRAGSNADQILLDTDGSVSMSGELTVPGLTLDDATPKLLFADTDDDYFSIMTEGDDDLHFASEETGAHAHYKFFTADGDGTNNISLSIFGVGTSSSTTNAEWLEWHYRYSAGEFELGSRASGTGTVRPLEIYTGNNSDQILLETDGNVYMSGNLVIEKSITFEVDNTNVSNPPTDAELDSAYGTPATVGAGWTTYLDDNGAGTNFYQVVSDGTNWWTNTFTKAV